MNTSPLIRWVTVLVLGISVGSVWPASLRVVFDGVTAEHRWSLKEFNPELPADWTSYNFLVLKLKGTKLGLLRNGRLGFGHAHFEQLQVGVQRQLVHVEGAFGIHIPGDPFPRIGHALAFHIFVLRRPFK